jgi:hypothetical protein
LATVTVAVEIFESEMSEDHSADAAFNLMRTLTLRARTISATPLRRSDQPFRPI